MRITQALHRAALPAWARVTLVASAAFLLGFGWQFARAERADRNLEEVKHAVTTARLEASLAAATIETQRGRYETARQLASEFFTAAQGSLVDAPPAMRDPLRHILSRRDTTITLLSRGEQQAAGLLTEMHSRLRTAARAPQSALPSAGRHP
jgi:hypothetical protein